MATLPGCGELLKHAGPGCVPGEGEDAVVERVSGNNQSGAPGETLPLRPTVRTTDACAVPLPGQTIRWNAVRGSVSSTVTTTDAAGQASVEWTLDDHPGNTSQVFAEFEGPARVESAASSVTFIAGIAAASNGCTPFVLNDEFNGAGQWTKTSEATPGFQDSVLFQPSDGNPDGYRRMTHVLAGRGLIVVSHLFDRPYPLREGAIRSIHYSEDRKEFDPPFAGAAVAAGIVVQQGQRRILRDLPEFRETEWRSVRATVLPSDLPGFDLGTSGGEIRFGYYRANSDSTATVQHGIDNWRVEICR